MGDTFNLSGNFSGSNINIKSTLTNVSQTIGSLPSADDASKQELQRLIQKLNEALQKVPPEKAEDAEAVADYAKDLVEITKDDKPNKTKFRITGEGLKEAAKSIAEVVPIATQIVMTVAKLAGL